MSSFTYFHSSFHNIIAYKYGKNTFVLAEFYQSDHSCSKCLVPSTVTVWCMQSRIVLQINNASFKDIPRSNNSFIVSELKK